MNIPGKRCRKCGETEWTSFKCHGGKLGLRCRPCEQKRAKKNGYYRHALTPEEVIQRTIKRREYRKNMTPEQKEKRRACAKRWYTSLRGAARNAARHRENTHGISPVNFSVMYFAQCGRCAICRKPLFSGKIKKTPHVDHDHKNGKVRGLLCHECNLGIGLLGDDPSRVYDAYRYLAGVKLHPCEKQEFQMVTK
jgi:hypothetical protein